MVDGAMKPAERALRYGGRRSEARGAGATPMVDGAVTPTGTPAAPLLLSGGLVGGRRQDIAIRDGRIERAGAGLDASGYQTLDVTDRLVLPGFVESHIHPDKAFIADRTQGLSAGGPCATAARPCARTSRSTRSSSCAAWRRCGGCRPTSRGCSTSS